MMNLGTWLAEAAAHFWGYIRPRPGSLIIGMIASIVASLLVGVWWACLPICIPYAIALTYIYGERRKARLVTEREQAHQRMLKERCIAIAALEQELNTSDVEGIVQFSGWSPDMPDRRLPEPVVTSGYGFTFAEMSRALEKVFGGAAVAADPMQSAALRKHQEMAKAAQTFHDSIRQDRMQSGDPPPEPRSTLWTMP